MYSWHHHHQSGSQVLKDLRLVAVALEGIVCCGSDLRHKAVEPSFLFITVRQDLTICFRCTERSENFKEVESHLRF